jgi:hypothetical protein
MYAWIHVHACIRTITEKQTQRFFPAYWREVNLIVHSKKGDARLKRDWHLIAYLKSRKAVLYI